MRTDHTSLADLIATANAGPFGRAVSAPNFRAWWPVICRLVACAVSAYIVFVTLALFAEYMDWLGQ